jgi:hypothetical protein
LRILLDEDVSQPLLEPLRRILKPHAVDHVNDIVWKGKKDVQVLRDAPVRGYGMLVTHNLGQLRIPDEVKAIKRSGIHHVTYVTAKGLTGEALGMASLLASMRRVVAEAEASDEPVSFSIAKLTDRQRHTSQPVRVLTYGGR